MVANRAAQRRPTWVRSCIASTYASTQVPAQCNSVGAGEGGLTMVGLLGPGKQRGLGQPRGVVLGHRFTRWLLHTAFAVPRAGAGIAIYNAVRPAAEARGHTTKQWSHCWHTDLHTDIRAAHTSTPLRARTVYRLRKSKNKPRGDKHFWASHPHQRHLLTGHKT